MQGNAKRIVRQTEFPKNCVASPPVDHAVNERLSTSAAGASQHAGLRQPLGARSEALFAVEADDAALLGARLAALAAHARHEADPIELLARDWFRKVGQSPDAKLGLSLVARSREELRHAAAA